MKQVRSKLFESFKQSGIVDSLKTHLRTEIVKKLQPLSIKSKDQKYNITANRFDQDFKYKIAVCIIYD